MPSESDAMMLAEHAEAVLSLSGATLPDDYFYQSLPLCTIDAVFSIGVRYSSTRATVDRYCQNASLKKLRPGAQFAEITEQESISSFCRRTQSLDAQHQADTLYGNRQRTSPRSGILKAEAVKRFAECLQAFKVDYFQDVHKVI